MTENSPLSVRIEKPGKPLGEVMNEIRAWLDSNKIQPAEFKQDAADPAIVAFSIRFAREDEARLFAQEFA